MKATEENKQSFESGREVNLNPLYVRSVVYSFGSGMVSPVIAIYNLIIGLVTFAGSLIAGYLADFAIDIYGFGSWPANCLRCLNRRQSIRHINASDARRNTKTLKQTDYASSEMLITARLNDTLFPSDPQENFLLRSDFPNERELATNLSNGFFGLEP